MRSFMRTLRLGVKSLLLHKLRSCLTTAGILCGVAAVIAMLAVAEGASREALERYEAMGTKNILITSKKPVGTQQNSEQSVWSAMIYGLTYKEMEQVRSLVPAAEHVVPVRHTPRNLTHGSQWTSSVVVGTVPAYLPVVNMQVGEGRWLTPVDLEQTENIAILGASLARTLFPLVSPLGKMVNTGNEERFRVVGVLDYQGRAAGPAGTTLDECLFIPITASRKRYGDETTKRSGGSMERERVELHEIKVKLAETSHVIPVASVLRHMLEPAHNTNNDIEITVPLELLRQKEAEARMFTVLLGAIAGISLLVGGIGIMNVMLATVTERTREIGIRRALGAKKKHIISQFLVETAALSAAGGLLGVAAGLALPALIEQALDQKTQVLFFHVVLAFISAATFGLVFGIYPAWRAANMDPVEALRHE